MALLRRRLKWSLPPAFSSWMVRARRAPTLALLAASACEDPVAPEALVPFAHVRYTLIALGGHPLPAAFEFQGSTYLIHTGTVEFVDDTTVTWQLDDLIPVPPATVPLSILGTFRYRQTALDSVEIGGKQIGPFSVSPWGYARRMGDTLAVRTVDPIPLDPRMPDFAESPLGLHLWRFVRI